MEFSRQHTNVAATSYSRGSSWPRDWTHISCISCIGRQILYQLCHLGSPHADFFASSESQLWDRHLLSTMVRSPGFLQVTHVIEIEGSFCLSFRTSFFLLSAASRLSFFFSWWLYLVTKYFKSITICRGNHCSWTVYILVIFLFYITHDSSASLIDSTLKQSTKGN